MAASSGNTRWRGVLLALWAALTTLVIAGFTGPFHSVGDSLALLRPQAGFMLLLCAISFLLLRAKRLAFCAAAFSAIAFGTIASGFVGPSQNCRENCITLYQKNLLQHGWPRTALADDILASDADIVTLQEVSAHNRDHMANMFSAFPNQVTCRFGRDQNVAVLTRLPVVEGSEFCIKGRGMTGMKVVAPGGQQLWAVSLHLFWPYPYSQSGQAEKIAAIISELDAPVLIAGDFNMVPWGFSVQRIAQAAGNEPFGTIENTHSIGNWAVPLSIDNLLLPKGAQGSVELRPYFGSDHLGKLARFQLH